MNTDGVERTNTIYKGSTRAAAPSMSRSGPCRNPRALELAAGIIIPTRRRGDGHGGGCVGARVMVFLYPGIRMHAIASYGHWH
jgi:hypothetical protein